MFFKLQEMNQDIKFMWLKVQDLHMGRLYPKVMCVMLPQGYGVCQSPLSSTWRDAYFFAKAYNLECTIGSECLLESGPI